MHSQQGQRAHHFADRLIEAVRAKGTPLCVGLDPRFDELPKIITQEMSAGDPEAVAECYDCFCREIIDVVAPLVPAVKIQSAFFEAAGPCGLEAMAGVMRYAQRKALRVILDAKRSDIGSTAQAYADAYLGGPSGPWACDALTVNPYLGEDSLEPFVARTTAGGSGLFVLVKTSNPGSRFIQDRDIAGRSISEHVAELVESHARRTQGVHGYGSVGGVVGATYPEHLARLRKVMPHALLLVPGFGAQGGTGADVAPAFDARGLGAIVNSSRAIIFAYRSQPGAGDSLDWQSSVEAATRAAIGQLRAALPASS